MIDALKYKKNMLEKNKDFFLQELKNDFLYYSKYINNLTNESMNEFNEKFTKIKAVNERINEINSLFEVAYKLKLWNDEQLYHLAFKIAIEAHKGQVDKAGVDYIEHPKAVAELLETKEEKIVAILHDVVEDTKVTFQDLEQYWFPNNIIIALKLLTKPKKIDYMEYIKKIKENPLAKKVKIADLTHNSDLSRLKEIIDKDLKRLEKYRKALALLKGE